MSSCFKKDPRITNAVITQNFFNPSLSRQINLDGWFGG